MQGTEKVKPSVTVMPCVISLLVLGACCHLWLQLTTCTVTGKGLCF